MTSLPAPSPRDPEIVAVARTLLDRRHELTEGMVERIQAEVDFYRNGPVSEDDLRSSCQTNLERVLWPLVNGEAIDFRPPRQTGHRRATQRVPLPEVMSAYRVGFRFIWESMVEEARVRGGASSEALVGAASALWAANDEYTEAMSASYRETLAVEMRHDERARSALVESLLEGNATSRTSVWEVAELLRLPASPSYVVVAAEVPHLAAEALPGIEARLVKRGIATQWQLKPDVQVGIACLKSASHLQHLVSVIDDVGEGRVGVSPEFTSLDQTAAAHRLARIAMAASPPGGSGLTVFDSAPLAVTAVSASEVLPRVATLVLGGVLDLPADDRTVLLETLEAWRDCQGSAALAAAKLYCHPNTVRHRLRRVEALSGRSLSDPRAIAELCLAVEAVRILPPASG